MRGQGNHHFGLDVDSVFGADAGGFEDRPDLHLGQFRDKDFESYPSGSKHRIQFT